jgi:hypothetical protein
MPTSHHVIRLPGIDDHLGTHLKHSSTSKQEMPPSFAFTAARIPLEHTVTHLWDYKANKTLENSTKCREFHGAKWSTHYKTYILKSSSDPTD